MLVSTGKTLFIVSVVSCHTPCLAALTSQNPLPNFFVRRTTFLLGMRVSVTVPFLIKAASSVATSASFILSGRALFTFSSRLFGFAGVGVGVGAEVEDILFVVGIGRVFAWLIV